MKRIIILCITLCLAIITYAKGPDPIRTRPALIVGIVVDQMRYDYITRYWDRFGEGGFKRLVSKGFSCEEAHYNYVPTYTAVGHSAIYTGTVPAYNGIVGNNWYERAMGKATYVTDDSTVHTIGTTSDAGKMSPRRLLSTTITDELRLVSNFKSKVIGISLKDRSSILPAGHRPNAAYWYDGSVGTWISSSYYFDALPAWVTAFNARHLADSLLQGMWTPLLPIVKYNESLADTQPYKNPFFTNVPPQFPYDLSALKAKLGYDLLRRVPFGNTYTLEFAQEAIVREKMGTGNETDFLAVSLSSTDYIGHQFGVRAVETEDTYLRLDRDLAKFFAFLDRQAGAGKYLVFLTADHGASENAAHMKSVGIPSGVFDIAPIRKKLEARLNTSFGSGTWILDYQNRYFYFNMPLLRERGVNLSDIADTCKLILRSNPGVADVMTIDEVFRSQSTFARQIQNGYNPKRSGELVLMLNPGWYEGDEEVEGGTTHGTGYAYDTHIPLVWYGWNIPHGATFEQVTICDIAPTLAAILRCDEPNACIGTPIGDLMKQLPLR
ncbi:MAG TPA: alkaline phosphatase PafA [Bacteroidota bacterium]|nr:alkaline phosphatase PafA [Bacteroidota bacterium]